MSGSSEEKKHPPTPKKLKDARKKGQSPRSADFVSAVSVFAGFGCLWLRAGLIEGKWHETVRLITKVQVQPFNWAVQEALGGLIEIFWAAVGPFLAAGVAAAILAGVLANGGLIVSFEPLMPKFEQLDPMKGLKRIASKRSLIELAKGLIKVSLLGASFFLVVIGTWKVLVYLPVCGMGCFGFVFAEIKLLTEIAAGAFLFSGLTDLLVQRWLFLQDMRMTETEAKRESKEQEGSPQVKHEHRRIRHETANEPPLGLHRATLIVTGQAMLIGLRYVRGETGVPIVVCRGEGEVASQLLAEAQALRLSIIHDHALARQLTRNAKLGNAVPARCFEGVARALYSAGLV
ncbi:EscU/YscU/HrcU family type III secretion system export apparatus switch protein [Bradyrhizobium sp. WSM3983]|uniref:EscU/YscU/HrcU family type III secretion system export apparatus switch protein n=1 Tax=Bradyrhizobium sp. WSM3983 TaxID=1038867 RepID=UPI0004036270|nr:EscU/YscU/HrcU family type III secretion system export apparatus switch protein [Bradyrhizobium sp. WSM3983]